MVVWVWICDLWSFKQGQGQGQGQLSLEQEVIAEVLRANVHCTLVTQAYNCAV